MANKVKRVELHAHSLGSIDGACSVQKMISIAKQCNVEYLAISDHNTFSECVKLWRQHGFSLDQPVIEVDGVKIISATEVTCRVGTIRNLSGNTAKLHVLIYGADMSPGSPISQLLELKRKNDLDCDIGMLRDLLHSRGHYEISEDNIRVFIRSRRETIPGFSSLGKKDVFDFLKLHKITIASSYKELCKLISKLPTYDRMNIDFDDLVKVARASGGEIVVAHIGDNIDRLNNVNKKILADYLVHRVDGFEKYYLHASDAVWNIIKNAIVSNGQKKNIYITGGSDFHDCSHGEVLGAVHGKELRSDTFNNFLKNIECLVEARHGGQISHRDVNISQTEIESIIKKYRDEYNSIMINSSVDLTHYQVLEKKKQKTRKPVKKSRTEQDVATMQRAKEEWDSYRSKKSSKTPSGKDDNHSM